MKLRKIPLEPLLEILKELYDSGADYIDISGEQNIEGNEDIKDLIKITIKPEYMSTSDEEDIDEYEYEEDNDSANINVNVDIKKSLSEDDLNNLIE